MLQHCLLCMLGQGGSGEETHKTAPGCVPWYVQTVVSGAGSLPQDALARGDLHPGGRLGVLCGPGLIIDASKLSSP